MYTGMAGEHFLPSYSSYGVMISSCTKLRISLLCSIQNVLPDLETLMRATLGALANFNEDEKMILTK